MSEQRGYRIKGMVQGVGFRWWARRQARALGVRGTVRNCWDGSVEIHAFAPEEVLEQFKAILAQGPPGAWVESVREFESTGELPAEFEIVL